jgi:hypothetical protein
MLSHYHLISFMAFSLVVLCTSEALVPSATPFLPPRGGSTSAGPVPATSGAGGACSSTGTTQRSLYVGDGNDGGDLAPSSSSSSPSSGGGGSGPPFNGAKSPPSKVRLAANPAARMPSPYRNGFKKPAMINGGAFAATAAATGLMEETLVTSAAASKQRNGVNGKKKNGVSSSPSIGAPFVDQPIPAEFIAETNLPTDVGQFRLRAYRTAPTGNEYTGREPAVIYAADKSPFGSEGDLREGVPVRIHDQCLTSEVFRSQR